VIILSENELIIPEGANFSTKSLTKLDLLILGGFFEEKNSEFLKIFNTFQKFLGLVIGLSLSINLLMFIVFFFLMTFLASLVAFLYLFINIKLCSGF